MNRNILKLINGFNSLQKDREEIKLELDKEVKAQKMCATQLKNLEKKLTEKMERREEMLGKYIGQFANVLAEVSDSIVVTEEDFSAYLGCGLFQKNYVLFNINNLSTEALTFDSKLLNEFAEDIVRTRVILGHPYNNNVQAVVKLDKEIKKNPTLAKEKLVAREIRNREDAIKYNF